ncbi:MAG: hypothetical protein JWP97_1905 [Labilithrix sp.]|nr:hypothetical protein [Labilithrix sp.]
MLTRVPRPRLASALTAALGGLAVVLVVQGCSSPDAPGEGCVDSNAEALKTCAKGPTVQGIDVSSYQGAVSFTKVKAAGKSFVFARISDGLASVDSRFASNWPAMKSAGLVRGSYQFFRPSQDAAAQAQLVVDKLAAAGGLKPGDLPPVLDLESADGQSSAVVVARAKIWLAKVEAALGVKPLVYTAAFMSSVIGTSFGGYSLWVANYGTTCPTMPSGWTDWRFWQSSDSGSVSGIGGAVDTDFFNGTLADLTKLTVPGNPPPPPSSSDGDDELEAAADAPVPFVGPTGGSEGATLGSSTPPSETTSSATIRPCE